jgi:hypothetical protein
MPLLPRLALRVPKGRETYVRRYGTAALETSPARLEVTSSAADLEAMLEEAGFDVDAVRYLTLLSPCAHVAILIAASLRR